MATVIEEDVPMDEPGPSSKRRRRLAEHGDATRSHADDWSRQGGHESDQERKKLVRTLRSFKAHLHSIDVTDIEAAMHKVVKLYNETKEAFVASSTKILLNGLHMYVADFISKHAPSIGQRIYKDLDGLKTMSPLRQALLDIDHADLWREFVCAAAKVRVKEQAIIIAQDGILTDDDEGVSRRDDDNVSADRALYMNIASVPFDHVALPQYLGWIEHIIMPVLNIWGPADLNVLHDQLKYQAYTALGRLRARQLFDIVSDFPRSSKALQDLVDCIGVVVNLNPYVSTELSRALRTRLLHPGASTQDIIEFYTHLIRSLRIVDPTDVILSHVVGPVRSYLRARADTVPVIVASLLGQAGEFTLLRDLMSDSTRAPGLSNGIGKNVGDYSLALYDEGDDGAEVIDIAALDESKRYVVIPSPETEYAPRPIDAGPDYRQSRKADVIAIVASIFEDEEGFIAALERSCADQYLRVRRYNTKEEYETNENLKKRFGDAWLAKCDVMLNDIKRSQRYDRSIHHDIKAKEQGEDSPGDVTPPLHTLHPLILSRQYWPSLKAEEGPGVGGLAGSVRGPGSAAGAPAAMFARPPKRPVRGGNRSTSPWAFFDSPAAAANDASLAAAATATEMATADMVMPGQMGTALEQYGKRFTKLCSGRRVRWLAGRGEVHVRLTMDDGRSIDERVLPVQAAVIELAAAASSRTATKDDEQTGDAASPSLPSGVLLLADAATQLQIEARYVREAFAFWTSRGILRESAPGQYVVVDSS